MSRELTNNTAKLAIGCGGSGGHFYPGMAIAEAWRESGGDAVLFVGGQHGESQLATALASDFAAEYSPSERLPAHPAALPRFGYRFLGAVNANIQLLRRHHIDAALVMGSFASAPMAVAARYLGKPLLLHEANAVPGRAIRWLGFIANELLLSLPPLKPPRYPRSQYIVGMPVRAPIMVAAKQAGHDEYRQTLCRKYGLSEAKPILLVFGGSQGAQSINRIVTAAVIQAHQAETPFQVAHLCGNSDDTARVKHDYASTGVDAFVAARSDTIEELYLIADYIICRGGASTIAELAILGKAAAYIPLPHATDDHQRANVQTVVARQAGALVDESDMTPDRVMTVIHQWLANPEHVRRQSVNIRQLARPNAANTVVERLHACITNRHQ